VGVIRFIDINSDLTPFESDRHRMFQAALEHDPGPQGRVSAKKRGGSADQALFI